MVQICTRETFHDVATPGFPSFGASFSGAAQSLQIQHFQYNFNIFNTTSRKSVAASISEGEEGGMVELVVVVVVEVGGEKP